MCSVGDKDESLDDFRMCNKTWQIRKKIWLQLADDSAKIFAAVWRCFTRFTRPDWTITVLSRCQQAMLYCDSFLFLSLLLICCTNLHVQGFRIVSVRSTIAGNTRIYATGSIKLDTNRASWSVEDDTAEIEWGSSVDKTKALAKQVEDKRVAEIMARVKPMDDFRLRYDPTFKEWIAQTGYTSFSVPAIKSESAIDNSAPFSLGGMWDNFVAQFQLPKSTPKM